MIKQHIIGGDWVYYIDRRKGDIIKIELKGIYLDRWKKLSTYSLKMIIPIRCFTCGKVLADKWVYYQEKCKEIEKRVDTSKLTIEDLRIDEKNKSTYFEESFKGELLDNIGLKKICCRRHMLGHVDLIDII